MRLSTNCVMLLDEARLRIRRGDQGRQRIAKKIRVVFGEIFLPRRRVRRPRRLGAHVLSPSRRWLWGGAVVLLCRVGGIRAWDCIYAEDYGVSSFRRSSTRGKCSSLTTVTSSWSPGSSAVCIVVASHGSRHRFRSYRGPYRLLVRTVSTHASVGFIQSRLLRTRVGSN
jgi:hypothetical protein